MESTAALTNNAICFGEVLWDMLPDSPQPGGAPLNVAYHLHKLGMRTNIISKIGNDPAGNRLLRLLQQWGIGIDLLQTDSRYATSEVLVKMNEAGEASYEILSPVAWDFIDPDPEGTKMLLSNTYFIFGSLSSRSKASKETLLTLLGHDAIKVFDINLREPFINKDDLQTLLSKADIAKFNQTELKRTCLLFGGLFEHEPDKVNFLQDTFNIPEIIVTKGSSGAAYYKNNHCWKAGGPAITVTDTIGSGDAFLAAFIYGRSKNAAPLEIIKNAVAMGAFIATKKGGCPEYQFSEFEKFESQHY